MTPLDQLRGFANAQKAEEMSSYHKGLREFLGVSNSEIDSLVKIWRATNTLAERLTLADTLWQSDIHEARVAAAKLLTQARLKPDDNPAWDLIKSWVPDFDSWAIADHVASAGARRLVVDSARLSTVADWTKSDHMWSRRAAMVMTLPWAKLNHLNAKQSEEREKILGWAASYTVDKEWFIQKAIGWWIRDLSKHDQSRAAQFLVDYGDAMQPFSRKIAGKYLP